MKVSPFDQLFPPNRIQFLAGFECTYAQTRPKERLDMLSCTMHDQYQRDDYKLIKNTGIRIVREGLAWSQIDKGNGVYDFSRFIPMMEVAKQEGMTVVWDLNHFDYPKGLDPFSDEFIQRFAEYSKHVWEVLRKHTDGLLAIIPINEISFMAWIGADRGWWAPFKRGPANGFKFKRQLVRAALAAMRAIRSLDENVVFIHSDPFMRRLAVSKQNRVVSVVDAFNNIIRFEAWDMLCGKTYPELGGSPEFLPAIGVNYYFHNQEHVWLENRRLKFDAMDWNSPDRIPFGDMLKQIQERYHVPILITETGSFGDQRVTWWKRTLGELEQAQTQGVDVRGVCAYPILDRPADVNYLFPKSGLWDFNGGDSKLTRHPENESLKLIQEFIQRHNNRKTRNTQTLRSRKFRHI